MSVASSAAGTGPSVVNPGGVTVAGGAGDPTFVVSGDPGDVWLEDNDPDEPWVHGDSGTNNWDWRSPSGRRNPRMIDNSALKSWGFPKYGEDVGYRLNTNVDRVFDLSATGAHFDAPAEANEVPLLATGGPGSTPALDLGESSGDHLIADGAFAADGDRPTLIVWGREAASAGIQRFLFYGAKAGVGTAIGVAANGIINRVAFTSYAAGRAQVGLTGAPDSSDHVFIHRYTETVSSVKLDGVTLAASGPPAGWTGGEDLFDVIDQLIIGGTTQGGGRYYGHALYNRLLTDSEQMEIALWTAQELPGLTAYIIG